MIKQVRLTKLKPADRAAAFQEATVLAAMHHPFIVSYVDQFEESNCLYIVMEYADGGDLALPLPRPGPKRPFSAGRQPERHTRKGGERACLFR